MSQQQGWIGVDLDGTLATYDGWKGVEHIGAPVPAMLERVKAWLAGGIVVKIFTARVSALFLAQASDEQRIEAADAFIAIEFWCDEHLGQRIPITAVKDYGLVELWDDRCVQVIHNAGIRADGGDPPPIYAVFRRDEA